MQWWRMEIGVGVERCPIVPGYHWSHPPRNRTEFAALARANHAAYLHGQGMSYAVIGGKLGVSTGRARQLVRRALDPRWLP